MSAKSKIEWTEITWNPLLGCSRVSPGCDRCYAIPQANMRAANPHPAVAEAFAGLTHKTAGRLDWTGQVNLLPDRLTQPLRTKKPSRIFVNSLADLFHDQVSADYIAQVFAVMALTPQHTYQVLTKRHARMRSLLGNETWTCRIDDAAAVLAERHDLPISHVFPLPNVWLGVSCEDQQWADIRIPALLDTPAAVRWISAEPLLGPIVLHDDWLGTDPYCRDEPSLSWVVVGGESGPGARPMFPAWARSLRDQVTAADVPFLFKQWGDWGPAPFIVRVCDPTTVWRGTPQALAEAKRAAEACGATHVTAHPYERDGQTIWHVHEIGHKPWSLERAALPDGHDAIRRWGKKRSGRELDGRIWDEYPGGAS